MTHNESEIKSYLRDIFQFDETEQLEDVLNLRSSFLDIPLKNSPNYDNLSLTWFAWKEQFENTLLDFWELDEDDKFQELLDLFNFLEGHPYDKFQKYTLRFKAFFLRRDEVLSLDKKEYTNIKTRDFLNIFIGTRNNIFIAKNKMMDDLFYQSKRKSYKVLMKEFKLLFPEVYKSSIDFLLPIEKNKKKN